MKLCILEDAYDGSSSPMAEYDPPSEPEHFFGCHEWERHFITKANGVGTVMELSRQGFDVFVNLCDGAWEEDRPGIEIVQTLEQLNVPFTGADSTFYDPTREMMKRVAHYYGIRTPAGVFAHEDADIERAAETLRFPLIVKHPNSYSSIGLTPASRVETPRALREQCAAAFESFGSALIEEFVDGREFTVLVAENPDDPYEPVVYEPVEFRFPKGETFKHFDMKWKTYHDMWGEPFDDKEGLTERLKTMSKDLFVGLRGTGYGRCDVRMDEQGVLYMLEINPNCGVFYGPDDPGSADFILQYDPAGHKGFVETIVRAAFNRVVPPPAWTVRFDEGRSYGVFATRDIPSGEIVERYEERPHVLVSRSHVEAQWDERHLDWFERFAYPLTDEIYVMWADDPAEWKPINHACDPNAWLNGLNLTARRRISKGEQITVDYATFCNESMRSFECDCGSPDCRRVIRGTDYLEPFVDRYGDHVSDYVDKKRKALRYGERHPVDGRRTH